MTEPAAVPSGAAGASLPAFLSLPPAAAMAASSAAWQHHCGQLNVGDYLAGDVCGGCMCDTDPADVKIYRLVNLTNTVLSAPTSALDPALRARMRRVAALAPRVLPGAVGETVEREIRAWEEFGYRFGSARIMLRLLDDIEKRAAKTDETKDA